MENYRKIPLLTKLAQILNNKGLHSSADYFDSLCQIDKQAKEEAEFNSEIEERKYEEGLAWQEYRDIQGEKEYYKLSRESSGIPDWDSSELLEFHYNWLANLSTFTHPGIKSAVMGFIDKDVKQLNMFVYKFGNGQSPKLLGSGYYGLAGLLKDNIVLKIYRGQEPYDKNIKQLLSKTELENQVTMILSSGILNAINKATLDDITEKRWTVLELFKIIKGIDIVRFIDQLSTRLEGVIYREQFKEYSKLNTHIDMSEECFRLTKIIDSSVINKDFKVSGDDICSFNLYYMLIEKAFFIHFSNSVALIKGLSKELPLSDKWFWSFVKQIVYKTLSGRADFHSGNVGIRELIVELIYLN